MMRQLHQKLANFTYSYSFLRVRDIQSDELGLFLYDQTQPKKEGGKT